ncbi:hypothetical protein HCG49_03075 [Arenibacter sp. 6A1]|nr:hypothetical protein [Arenibacter sp. 6A1]
MSPTFLNLASPQGNTKLYFIGKAAFFHHKKEKTINNKKQPFGIQLNNCTFAAR